MSKTTTMLALAALALASVACNRTLDYSVWSQTGGKIRFDNKCDAWQENGAMKTDCSQGTMKRMDGTTFQALTGIGVYEGVHKITYNAKAIPDPGYQFDGWKGCKPEQFNSGMWAMNGGQALFAELENGTVCSLLDPATRNHFYFSLASSEKNAYAVAQFSRIPAGK